MTPSRIIRRLFLPALTLATLWSSLTPAHAAACEEISAYQPAAPPSGGGPDLTVAVVIHIMERPEHPCEVRKVWTPEQVATIFGAGTQDNRSVNSVWGETRIRFAIQEVVLDTDSPPADLVDSQERITVPMTGPKGSVEYERAFSRLVSGNRDHMVNIYLWRRISGKPIGFGRSTRSGNGKATVFLDNRCGERSLRTCATFAAHELGHALGLYHAGPNTCSFVDEEFRPLCRMMAKPCPGVPLQKRLMKPIALGRLLCPVEVEKAELMATNEFQ